MPEHCVLHQASMWLAHTLPHSHPEMCHCTAMSVVPVSVYVCVRVRLDVSCSAHPALAATAATNMSSMLHDSVQALAGDGLGHGVPLGQTGL